MPGIREDQLAEYLRLHSIPGYSAPLHISPEPSEPGEQRFRIVSGASVALLTCYEPAQSERFRREVAGLRLGETLSLGPALLLADESGVVLGGSVVVTEAPRGETLGDQWLSDEDMHNWLFLLLALHHLSPNMVSVPSSMSADAATWWQRTQPAWEACQRAYGQPRYRELIEALTRLHAIVSVHIEVNSKLWEGLVRRPCHGNPVPAHVARAGDRLMLLEWGGFGLGDPALEVGRVAALSTLSGELNPEQYVRFVSDYLIGMRDLRDATLEDRLRVFASILPLGFCFTLLDALASDHASVAGEERTQSITQMTRALIWIQDTLGVRVGEAEELLAPLQMPDR